MRRRWLPFAILSLLASPLGPGRASAHSVTGTENAAWAFELVEQVDVQEPKALTPTSPHGWVPRECDAASGAFSIARGGRTVTQGICESAARSGQKYVGQSGNIPRRIGEHARSGKLPKGNPVSTTEVLGGRTAREIAEQRRIDALGGIDNLENKINPIGPKRQHLLDGGK